MSDIEEDPHPDLSLSENRVNVPGIPAIFYSNYVMYNHKVFKYKDVDVSTPHKVVIKTKVTKFEIAALGTFYTGITVGKNKVDPFDGSYSLIVNIDFSDFIRVIM